MRLLGRQAECDMLDTTLADALAGRSRVVILRGEAGTGKSSLLNYAVTRATDWRAATATGVESEMELPFSGLHQLCAPILDHLDRLPVPQRAALSTVFGYEAGPPPDRFMVGLATLTLLADAADQQPLLCIIDDAQWLDEASAQIIVFVARRLLAERIAIVGAARTGIGDGALAGLPVIPVSGLSDGDARELLLDNLPGPIDAAVCEQLVVESRGNPLALLELPRTWNITDFAGGFGLAAPQPVAGRIEQSFAQRLVELPEDSRLLVLAAAAEPLGDLLLLHRASDVLGIELVDASDPAVDAGLLTVSGRVEFAHPLVRSAAYRNAAAGDRHRVHRALADATDASRDPDRRVWHLAHAAPSLDEGVAAELERSAGRAQSRGGVAAAAAFYERSASLSPDLVIRARRALAAAEAKQLAGAPQAASTLLTMAEDGPLDELHRGLAQRLKGQIALDLRKGAEAVPLLLDAARQLAPLRPELARQTHLHALWAGSVGGRFSDDALRAAAWAARDAPPSDGEATGSGLLLDGLAIRFTDGYVASAVQLRHALHVLVEEVARTHHDARWPWFARRIALDLFDLEAFQMLATHSAELARSEGALGVFPLALDFVAMLHMLEGDLNAAEARLVESETIADATGAARIAAARLTLAGFRGDKAATEILIERERPIAVSRGEGVVITFGEHASAVLHNGLGEHEAALGPAARASERDELAVSVWSLPELVEAAVRTGKHEVAAAALERLAERTQAAGTEWARGVEARSRALCSADSTAGSLYAEAIRRLSLSNVVPEQARAHLLYGEFLRHTGNRTDARDELRTAHRMFDAMGMQGFAERARRDLTATGEKMPRRQPETRKELTSQEAQIARLAAEGLSNPEIGAQLFLSSRTIEWHMRKVFTKLGITSRAQLGEALTAPAAQARA